jgi:hypothetical protein
MRDFAAARVWTSILAASVGVVICVVQQHFRLQLVRPTGLWVMFHHRCGLVMVAAVGWMAFEVGNAVWSFRPAHSPHPIEPTKLDGCPGSR